MYWIKTPSWLKKLFPKEMIWRIPAGEVPTVYLTFDDGPHPKATPFVLDQLGKFNAKATFFCIGKNVAAYPGIYQQLVSKGHSAGNHTHNHVNGWHTAGDEYMDDIYEAAKHINSRLFRPPYGRVKISQAKKLVDKDAAWKIYMWDVLSADFDTEISPQQCMENVLNNIEPGSIVVFHDSEKAWERMSFALPHVLEFCRSKNWKVEGLPKD